MRSQDEIRLLEAAELINALYQQGLQFPPWSDERARVWSESLTLFVTWFLQTKLPIPDFHKQWHYLLNRYKLLLLLAPRDHAKSTVVTIHYPLWRLCMNPNQSILLVGASVDVARLALRSIKGHFESNDLLRAGFPDMVSNDPTKWTETEIIVNRPDFSIKDPSIIAVGAGGGILTRRVTGGLFAADDLVQDADVDSDTYRKKLHDWFFGVLMNVREPEDQGVVIGTRKHFDDLYSELLNNPEFHTKIYDAIQEEGEDGSWKRVLWTDKWNVDSLQHKLVEISSLQFNKNYRNIVLEDKDSKFPISWFDGGEGKFRGCFDLNGHLVDTHWTDDVRKIIAVDLASGQTEGLAYFVALVVSMDERGDFHLLNLVRDRLPFPDQVKVIIELYDRYYPEAVVVENNAYQQAMIDAIPAQAPRVPVIPFTTGRGKNAPEHGLMMLQPLIEAGRIRFPMGDPTSQAISEVVIGELNRFGVAKFNDTVMALWFAISRFVGEGDGEEIMQARIL